MVRIVLLVCGRAPRGGWMGWMDSEDGVLVDEFARSTNLVLIYWLVTLRDTSPGFCRA
ncbi:Protein of unknown function [Pyronema omphalodes CBS 100304]|uniref:Uncharacterized protein n=1 Tax=Pyronema omphalodes (strain CBS 100304) TaxID=1076935 RepID=U4L257_PYROM|nr:Protein of unknown function [Pyronema omphalodes CBS 100304]